MSLKDPTKSTYISIRDDAGIRSLSRNERAFTRECALPTLSWSSSSRSSSNNNKRRSLRVDGRTSEQVRPVRLHLGRWDHGSECTVQWGNTRVTSLCTAELVRPNLDRPNEGQLVISVDLSPGASPSFRQAPPVTTGGMGGGGGHQPNYAGQSQRLLSNRILRCIEKIIIVGGTLDLEALCIVPSQWVFRFQLALTVLDDGGNIIDAAVMAAIASLRHYRKPQVDLEGGAADTTSSTSGGGGKQSGVDSPAAATAPVLVPSHLKEPTPLPLHHTPLSISFAFLPMEDGSSLSTAANSYSSSSSGVVAALVDPTDREELLQNGSLTVGMNTHAEVCLLDYGGGCELPPTQLQDCWKKAESSIRQLCTMLEKTLEDADQQAQKDRLAKLQQQQWPDNSSPNLPTLPPLPPNSTSPYFQQSDNPLGAGGGDDDYNMMDIEVDLDKNQERIRQMQDEADEAYKRIALDYEHGHKAIKVREDNDNMRLSSQPYFSKPSKFVDQLMQSAQTTTKTTSNNSEKEEPDAGTNTTTAENPASAKMDNTVAKQDKTAESDKSTTTKAIKAANSSSSSSSTSKKPNVSTGQIDSDEEESTQMLQSEFESSELMATTESSITNNTTKAVAAKEDKMDVEDDDDIDDLAMAISKKKKKKKKDKK